MRTKSPNFERSIVISMSRQSWKPGNMLYPVPAVLITAADKQGNANVLLLHGQVPYAVIRLWCLFPYARKDILII